MSAPGGLLNEISEVAIAMIKTVFHDYDLTQLKVASRPRTVITHPRLGRHTDLVARREACLFRMVSIVEAFTDSMFELSLRDGVPTGVDIVDRLVIAAIGDSSRSWPERKESVRTYFPLSPLTGFPRWNQIEAAIEARNSIAHGLGELTPRQRRDQKVKSKFALISIRVIDGRLDFDRSALLKLQTLLTDFIRYVDSSRGYVEGGST